MCLPFLLPTLMHLSGGGVFTPPCTGFLKAVEASHPLKLDIADVEDIFHPNTYVRPPFLLVLPGVHALKQMRNGVRGLYFTPTLSLTARW